MIPPYSVIFGPTGIGRYRGHSSLSNCGRQSIYFFNWLISGKGTTVCITFISFYYNEGRLFKNSYWKMVFHILEGRTGFFTTESCLIFLKKVIFGTYYS